MNSVTFKVTEGRDVQFETNEYPTPESVAVKAGECLLKKGVDPGNHYQNITGNANRGVTRPGDLPFCEYMTGLSESEVRKAAERLQLQDEVIFLKLAIGSFNTAIGSMEARKKMHQGAIESFRNMLTDGVNAFAYLESIAIFEEYIADWNIQIHSATDTVDLLRGNLEDIEKALEDWHVRNGHR